MDDDRCWDMWLKTLTLSRECEQEVQVLTEQTVATPEECKRADLRWLRSIKLVMDIERHLWENHIHA